MKKFLKFLNIEVEQNLIGNQNPNGLRISTDNIIKNNIENNEFEEKKSS